MRFFDTKTSKKALLIHTYFFSDKDLENLKEFEHLILSSGLQDIEVIHCRLTMINSKYFIGIGKTFEIKKIIKMFDINYVFIDHKLSPVQKRNLENVFRCRVFDRIELILDIFSKRARSYEGKLQVKLAHFKNLSTRLVRGWNHLERQKGGVGLRGGPGEKQLETDRRLLSNNIKKVQEKLRKVEKQRRQKISCRNKLGISSVSLIGYTNAGKSTLFNQLSGSNVHIEDRLFSTLDPTLRSISFANGTEKILLSDTVGFIRHLPHDLIAAFKATLQEIKKSNLLLHIVNASDTRMKENIDSVNNVLKEIDAHKIPVLMVMNKIDLIHGKQKIDRDIDNLVTKVWISAKNGSGLQMLMQALIEKLPSEMAHFTLHLPIKENKLRSYFYNIKAVKKEWLENNQYIGMKIFLSVTIWNRLCKKEPILVNYLA